MRRMFFGAAALLGLLLAFASSATAAELTLNDCIEQALRTRYNIIATRGAEDLAKAGHRAALGAFLPSVDAYYARRTTEYSDRLGSDIDPTTGAITYGDRPDYSTTSTSYGVESGMALIKIGNWFNYFAARQERDAARLDVIASEQDLIQAVKTAYYLYLAAEQNVAVQQDAVKRSEEQLKLIQSKYELGSAALSDVLKQKVQLGNDQLNLLEAENSVLTTRASLAFTVGVDPRTDIVFSTKYLVREFNESVDDAIAFGLSNRPALLSLERGAGASRNRLKSARSEYLPSVNGFLSWGADESTTDQYGPELEFKSKALNYGFQLNWAVFNGFSREREVTRSKVARNNARALLADERNRIASEIKAKYSTVMQLREARRVATDNVAAATEDLKITQEKYNLGAATILDLLNAQVSLKQAQVALIRVDFDSNTAIANLENLMGRM